MRKTMIAAALAAFALVAPSAGRAVVLVPQVTDAQGDANGVNSQGSPVLASADTMTPKAGAQAPDNLDILSVRFSTEFSAAKKATNLLVSLTLNAAPSSGDFARRYVVTFGIAGCNSTHELRWDFVNPSLVATSLYAPGPTFIRGACNTVEKTVNIGGSKLAGKTLTFRIPLGELAKTGTVLTNFQARSLAQAFAGESTTPYTPAVFDIAKSAKSYTIGT